jgi:hypothetical protein
MHRTVPHGIPPRAEFYHALLSNAAIAIEGNSGRVIEFARLTAYGRTVK